MAGEVCDISHTWAENGSKWIPGFLNSIFIHPEFKGCDQKKQDIEKTAWVQSVSPEGYAG